MSLFADNANNLGTPYWWEDGANLPDLPSELPAKAELLIIGAGYTGLSAAIAASDAGVKVVVVDAGVPGIGASSRNGGMFGAHPRLGFDELANKFSAATATGIFNEAQAAFDFTSGLIQRENIKCHFEQCGRVQLAWTKAHFAAQRTQVASLKSTTNMNVELIEQQELAGEINSPCFFGGIRFADHASLHPRQFHDGLLAAALKRGIAVIQNCPIEQVSKTANGFLAIAHDGSELVAEKTLMATNGYTQGKFNWFLRRVFPLPSFLVATEPLSENLIKSLAPGKRMMVETRARHSYFRVSPDGTRIIYGGRAAMTPISPQAAAKRLHESLCEVWPELSDVKLTHSWSGYTGYAFSHMPQVGTHDGIQYSMGYSGSGVALAPYLGAKAAYLSIGDPRGETAYQNSQLDARWFHHGRKPHFLKSADLWYQHVVDRRDNRAAKLDKQSQK